MKFTDYLFLQRLVEDMSKPLDESVFDDLSDVKNEKDINNKIDTLARLLFYVKMHQGSLGNTDLKMFYTDVPIEQKLKQIENTINNHKPEFQKVVDMVKDKINQHKEFDVFGAIARFFENENRLPAGFKVP